METTVNVPDGLTATIDGQTVKVKGPKGELTRAFAHPLVALSMHGNDFKITSKNERRATRALVGTWRAHLKNMFTGVTAEYERKMRVVHVHFPMSVKLEGSRLSVLNLLGQKSPRFAQIEPGVDAKLDGDTITVKGISKEAVGQTISHIENGTKLSNRRDRRRFYDGIYAIA